MRARWIIFGTLVGFALVFLLPASYTIEIYSVSREADFEVIAENELPAAGFSKRLLEKFPDLLDWERPTGPPRVALQVGHWKNAELPDELEHLRGKSLGTSGGGVSEVEVNFQIAERVATLLEAEGVIVDILPATIPMKYYADAFVALHVDGSTDPSTSGYKAAGPYMRLADRNEELLTSVEEIYGEVTALRRDDMITQNMRGYYAFNWWRNEYALHPKTPAIILEMGFLTSPHDQAMLIHAQEVPAQAIADAILLFLAGGTEEESV